MDKWEKILFTNIALARISRQIPQIVLDPPGSVIDAVAGKILASLHYLALVASFDEALAHYIETNRIRWPNKRNRDLFNRIEVVSGVVPTIDKGELHKIRERRNQIAHQPDSILSRPVTWEDLDDAISCICHSMKVLGLISHIPEIEAFYERTPVGRYGDELGPSGERLGIRHVVGAKLNGEVFLEFSTEFSYFPP